MDLELFLWIAVLAASVVGLVAGLKLALGGYGSRQKSASTGGFRPVVHEIPEPKVVPQEEEKPSENGLLIEASKKGDEWFRKKG